MWCKYLCGNQNFTARSAESSRRPPRHRRDVHPTHWLISTQAKARPRPRLAGAARGDCPRDARVRRRADARRGQGGPRAIRRRDTVKIVASDARRCLRPRRRDRRVRRGASIGVCCCVEINQCVGCTRQFFTKSFLGDDAAVLAPSSGEEPASPRHRAGVASMAWRATRRSSTNAP